MVEFKWVESLNETTIKVVTKEMAIELERCPHLFLTDKYPKDIVPYKSEIGFIGVFIGDALLPCLRIVIKEDNPKMGFPNIYPK